jgi:hypothetical protein
MEMYTSRYDDFQPDINAAAELDYCVWYANLFPTAESVEAMRRIDDGIRSLGYPEWPLTGSKRDVQDYLAALDAAVQAMLKNHVADFLSQHNFHFADLIDFYTGKIEVASLVQ